VDVVASAGGPPGPRCSRADECSRPGGPLQGGEGIGGELDIFLAEELGVAL